MKHILCVATLRSLFERYARTPRDYRRHRQPGTRAIVRPRQRQRRITNATSEQANPPVAPRKRSRRTQADVRRQLPPSGGSASRRSARQGPSPACPSGHPRRELVASAIRCGPNGRAHARRTRLPRAIGTQFSQSRLPYPLLRSRRAGSGSRRGRHEKAGGDKEAVAAARAKMTQLEEELRRAGAPAGWAR